MSENQEKTRRWYKKFFDEREDVDSFIWIVLAILLAVAIVTIVATGKCETKLDEKARSYLTVSDEIKNAIAQYCSDHNGLLPTLNGTYTNAECPNCSVINMSALLVENGGLLREAPKGLNLSPSGKDNCGGNTSLGCSSANSYIWIVNNDGVVFSYCAGAGCTTNNTGYQDVWP
ncbi:MAG: hypothetical protein WC562_02695 [Dehalococcoidia bacterium]